ncbi:DUF3667 domain-containing protein [Aureisphaera galaxeae]|uniref:DUF3667 domain-containing protein n=1 Tax=Aureisphaera galaxeae TaxID=1538023 RepID=UPI00235067F9|nr:DUF3667 domain-containing protein [Aureisphaera galaxeae]MDC8006142.1 DUF3667 domain-containing protein [Aureisphaera galaxeae]
MECKNCTATLTSENNYCSACGAKVIRNRLTMRNVWENFSEQFLNYDNRFLKTYLTMFRNPFDVITAYIDGIRKRYSNPLSYFAIAITLSGFQLFILRKFFPEAMDLSAIVPNQPNASVNVDWIYDYYSIVALINLPIYAVMGKLSFIGLKKFNYTEHLVIITYAVAQFSITNFFVLSIGVGLGVNYYIMGNVMNIIMMFYIGYLYKKLYSLSLGQILLRTLLFFGVMLIMLIIVSIIQFVILVFNGGLEEMIQAEKEKRGISYIASSIINWTS